jgi:hypothetical protein
MSAKTKTRRGRTQGMESPGRASAGERGYAYLLALLLAVTLFITMSAVMPNILTQGRREKEADMIWRGNQYKRAIRLYVQKNGKYPTSLDDLIKHQQGEVRYLRELYKDPMNPGDDGKWRLIYVTQTGILVGSVRYQTIQQLALADQHGGILPLPTAIPGAPGSDNSASGMSGLGQNAGSNPSDSSATGAQPGSNVQGSAPGVSSFGQSPFGQNPSGMNGQQPPSVGIFGTGGIAGLSQQQPQPLSGDIIGGNIIGVASKVEKPSVKVYRGGKKYKEWEFIYDPLMQTLTLGGQVGGGIQGGTTLGQPLNGPGAQQPSSPFGSSPGQTPPPTPPPSNPQ